MRPESAPPGGESERACLTAGAQSRWLSLKARMERELGPLRLAHSLAVADEAVGMGRRFGGDLLKLALAGLLHDGAKELGAANLLTLGEEWGLIGDPAERENPSLLHGPVGAWLAAERWGIGDPVILECIRYHTTGEAGLSREACIVFMADLIEPGRKYEGVDVLRQLCQENLRSAMIEALEQTFVYLERKKKPLHSGALRCLAWLKDKGGVKWKARN